MVGRLAAGIGKQLDVDVYPLQTSPVQRQAGKEASDVGLHQEQSSSRRKRFDKGFVRDQ